MHKILKVYFFSFIDLSCFVSISEILHVMIAKVSLQFYRCLHEMMNIRNHKDFDLHSLWLIYSVLLWYNGSEHTFSLPFLDSK